MKIGFISCVKTKQKGKHKAQDLYTSPLFVKSLAYSLKENDKVFILSAKYGLTLLDQEIEDYELTLNKFKKQERIDWSATVIEQFELLGLMKETEINFYCGVNYKTFLIKMLVDRGFTNIHEPTKGLSMGRLLSFYNKQLAAHGA